MKKIEAIIRPIRLNAVRDTLAEIGVTGMTITEVKGIGIQKGHTEVYRGEEYTMDFLPRIKLELIVADELTAICVKTITDLARTGKVGDGRVIVSPLEEVLNIRTGEVARS